MKESMWGYLVILMGIFVLVVMIFVRSYSTADEEDYYILKEVTEASMIDAVDYATYRNTGELKINKEKFVENFLRRFSETVNANKTYKLDFYDVHEIPPKVSVRIKTDTGNFTINSDTANIDVINKIDGILETKY